MHQGTFASVDDRLFFLGQLVLPGRERHRLFRSIPFEDRRLPAATEKRVIGEDSLASSDFPPAIPARTPTCPAARPTSVSAAQSAGPHDRTKSETTVKVARTQRIIGVLSRIAESVQRRQQKRTVRDTIDVHWDGFPEEGRKHPSEIRASRRFRASRRHRGTS